MQQENTVEMEAMHVRTVLHENINHQRERYIIQVQVVVRIVHVEHIVVVHEQVVVQAVKLLHQVLHEHIKQVRDKQAVRQCQRMDTM